MSFAIKSNESVPSRRYVLLIKSDRSWTPQSDDTRFLCKGLGETEAEARKIGFWSFVDGFIAPEALANGPLTDCQFRRSGSFERVGRYLGAVMQQSDQKNDQRDRVE